MTAPPPPPENIALLVEVLGLDNALRLIEAKGGTRYWVPMALRNSSQELQDEVEAEFGKEMAKALIRGFGGGYIVVPLCHEWRTALYAHRGMPVAKIALKLGCHTETVYRRIGRRREENRQSAWKF